MQRGHRRRRRAEPAVGLRPVGRGLARGFVPAVGTHVRHGPNAELRRLPHLVVHRHVPDEAALVHGVRERVGDLQAELEHDEAVEEGVQAAAGGEGPKVAGAEVRVQRLHAVRVRGLAHDGRELDRLHLRPVRCGHVLVAGDALRRQVAVVVVHCALHRGDRRVPIVHVARLAQAPVAAALSALVGIASLGVEPVAPVAVRAEHVLRPLQAADLDDRRREAKQHEVQHLPHRKPPPRLEIVPRGGEVEATEARRHGAWPPPAPAAARRRGGAEEKEAGSAGPAAAP